MATIPIDGPRNLRLSDFHAISSMYGNFAKSCRFLVHIKPRGYMAAYAELTKQLVYLCEAAELPGRAFVNVDVRYYGPNQKFPVQSQYEDINMTFLCRNKSYEREFFDNWQLVINPVNTYDFNYRDDYACEIDIYQYSDISEKVQINTNIGSVNIDTQSPVPEYKITLVDAYPILINPQPMTWQDDMFQRLIVNFTYTKWKRKGIDPEPRIGADGGMSFDLVQGRQNIRR